MTTNAILQLVLYVVVLVALVKPLGSFMARVYEGKPCGLDKIFGPLERLIYRMCGVDATAEMSWQHHVRGPHGQFPGADHRLRPAAAPVLPAIESARHGRHHARPGVQHQRQLRDEHELAKLRRRSDAQLPVANAGAAVQNFLSAASGIAVLVAMIRGFSRRQSSSIGNFWFDFTRSTDYILLPLSIVVALVLVSQGVVQTFSPTPRLRSATDDVPRARAR